MTTSNLITAAALEVMPLNKIVETYPETMPVFHRYGMDMCCGGSITVAKASQVHEVECNELTTALLDSISRERQ